MIIDIHGHYTTAPKALETWRNAQIAGIADATKRPRAADLKISDDEIRETIETNQLAKMRERGCERIYVDGGSVIQQLLAAGLVTDLTLNVVPVVLGEGVPLFGKTGRDLRLELVDTRRFDSGLVQVEYRSVR